MVSIFEPGPILMASIQHIRTIQESATAKVLAFKDEIYETEEYIISNRKFTKFRACLGHVKKIEGGAPHFISSR